MNALPQISGAARATAMMITDLGCRYDNHETGLVAGALAAAERGSPAYWSNTTSSNANSRLFLATANTEGLPVALTRWVDARHPRKTAKALLGTLIALNALAAMELPRLREAADWSAAIGGSPA